MVYRNRRFAGRRRGRNISTNRRGRVGKTRSRTAMRGRSEPGVVRGGSSSAITVTAIRRLVFLPKKFAAPPGDNDETKWWIELLKIAGRVLMTILVTAISGANTSGVPTGCVMRIGLGAEDLVYETPCVEDESGSDPVARYREAKVIRTTVTVIPAGHLTARAGTLYLSLVPCTSSQFLDDYGVRKTETTSLAELQQQPGVIMSSAVNPITTSYRPKGNDEAGLWHSFGSQAKTTTYGTGSTPIMYLTIGYSDFSSNTQDMTAQYALTEATFDVIVKSRVQLRQGESKVFVRRDPISMLDAKSAIVLTGKERCLVRDLRLGANGFVTWTRDDFEMM